MSRSLERIAQVAGSTGLSRVLGLVRDVLAVRVFGAGELHSAFLTAFTVPNLFRRLLGEGALTGAFVPVLTAAEARAGRTAAFELVNEVFTWLALSSGVIVLGGIGITFALPLLLGLGPRWDTLLELTRWLLPYVFLACTAAIQAAALNVFGRFLAPALGPVWLNLSMIVALNVVGVNLAATPEGRMAWLCAGVLVGGVLQLALPAVPLWKLGWRPAWRPRRSPYGREILALLLPSVAGVAIYQVNLAVSRLLAFELEPAAATLLHLASRLMELPIGVFSVAIATVVFPLLARAAADGDGARFAETFRQGVRLTLAVTVPAAAGLWLLAEPVGRVLFERGAFGPEATAALVPVVQVYALGLPGYSLVLHFTRCFHARRDTRTPVRAAAVSFVLNVALSLTLPLAFGTPGLALAGQIAVWVQGAVLAGVLLRAEPALMPGRIGADLAKILLAALVMTAVVALGVRLWPDPGPEGAWLVGAGRLGLLVGGGMVVYGAALWVLRVQGREEAVALVRRRLGRGGNGKGGR